MPHDPEIATRLTGSGEGPRSDRPLRMLFDNDLAGIFRVSWTGTILDCNAGTRAASERARRRRSPWAGRKGQTT